MKDFDFKVWHHLSQKAERLRYINDNEFMASLIFRFGLPAEEARKIYKAWKKTYLKSVMENANNRERALNNLIKSQYYDTLSE